MNHLKCRMCKNNKGLIRKYGLMYCRRCFKEVAEKLGFRKFG
ncbi:MAG: 30S ribosomal protein S14 [archaeon]